MRWASHSVSDINHVSLVPEVQHALKKWIKNSGTGVLIGGLALSFYAKPRETTDIDLMFLSDEAVPKQVPGFRKHRARAFEDIETNVEIEVCSPKSFHVPEWIFQRVEKESKEVNGIKVASAEGMIVLKLYSADEHKRRLKDMADIVAILENNDVDIRDWQLPERYLKRLNECRRYLN